MPHEPSSSLTLEIRDRGKGMSAEKLVEIQAKGSGVGIRGMRERVRHFGGEMTFRSDESGTTVFVLVPVPKAAVQPSEGEAVRAIA